MLPALLPGSADLGNEKEKEKEETSTNGNWTENDIVQVGLSQVLHTPRTDSKRRRLRTRTCQTNTRTHYSNLPREAYTSHKRASQTPSSWSTACGRYQAIQHWFQPDVQHTTSPTTWFPDPESTTNAEGPQNAHGPAQDPISENDELHPHATRSTRLSSFRKFSTPILRTKPWVN